MFKRLLWHLLSGNRVRMAVALAALISGGAVVSALLNLNMDISRKLTQEFRSLGANLVISAGSDATTPGAVLIEVSAMKTVEQTEPPETISSPYLYVIAHARSSGNREVVVVGTWLDRAAQLSPWWRISGDSSLPRSDLARCLVGRKVSDSFGISTGSDIVLAYHGRTANLKVAGIIDAGGPEDSQVFVSVPVAQALAGVNQKIQLIEVAVPGTPEEIRNEQSRLQAALPSLAIQPIPQITEAEGKMLRRIRFLIFSTGLLILVLTSLCILATMAALAVERRKDVGLMKALGGSMQKVLRIFLTELGILGVSGGIIGYVLGMFLSFWMGHRVFGASVTPRWEVLPATVALMLIVSLAGALPLRLLANIRPAVILRCD